jgi:hypothetical protein
MVPVADQRPRYGFLTDPASVVVRIDLGELGTDEKICAE